MTTHPYPDGPGLGSPPGPRARPAEPYRPARSALTHRLLGPVGITAVFLICFLVVLHLIAGSHGMAGSMLGLLLAILPVVVVLTTFIWVDRVEPEPLSHLLFAFGWGACVATLVALLFNQLGDYLLSAFLLGGHDPGAYLVAPVVEETTKGVVLLLFLFFRRKEFDGLVDGIVLAGVTAAGFAFTENILYFAKAFTAGSEYGQAVGFALVTFLYRGVLGPFAHPLFTGMTGIGTGLAAVAGRNRALRVLAPVGGWCLAVLLHAIWNFSATAGTFGLVYLLLMVPLFAGTAALVVWSRRMELKVLERHLPAYAAAGWIADWELPALYTFPGRRRARRWAKRALGKRGEQAMVELQLAATELAFLRAKAARGQDLHDFARREQELLRLLSDRKRVLAPAAGRRPFGATPVPARPAGGPPPPAGPLTHPDGVPLPPQDPPYPDSGYPGIPPQDPYRTP